MVSSPYISMFSLCDLECGFISAKLERIGNTIVWKDFYKNDYEKKINLMPYYFDFQDYKEAILSTFKQ